MQAAEGPEETAYEASMAADQRLLEPPPPGLHPPTISPAELASFHRDGFISLGRCAPLEQIEALGERIDDIMMGTVRHANPMLFQLCPSATDLPQFAEFGAAQTKLWKGATLKYRKVQDLEQDPLYLDYMSLPVFRDIASKIIGPRVSLYRTMFFNKVGTPSVKVKLLVTNPTTNLSRYVLCDLPARRRAGGERGRRRHQLGELLASELSRRQSRLARRLSGAFC
eukprot:COSAG06_NODE_1206_length_10270_cov_8.055255_2_plen_225_part_00